MAACLAFIGCCDLDPSAAGNAGGKGDPVMTGFGNRSFEFIGVPNTIYSLISEKLHKVSPLPLLIHLSWKFVQSQSVA